MSIITEYKNIPIHLSKQQSSPRMSRNKSPFEVIQTAIVAGDNEVTSKYDFIKPFEDSELLAKRYRMRRYCMINCYIRRHLSRSKSMDTNTSSSFGREKLKSNIHSDMAGVLCVNGRKPFTVRFSVDGKEYVPGEDDQLITH